MKKYPSNISIEVSQEKGYILPKGYSWDIKMVKGMKEGKVTVKDKMKLVHAVLFYSHDKLNGICSFYNNGKLIEKRTYVNNIAEGWSCEYEKGGVGFIEKHFHSFIEMKRWVLCHRITEMGEDGDDLYYYLWNYEFSTLKWMEIY